MLFLAVSVFPAFGLMFEPSGIQIVCPRNVVPGQIFYLSVLPENQTFGPEDVSIDLPEEFTMSPKPKIDADGSISYQILASGEAGPEYLLIMVDTKERGSQIFVHRIDVQTSSL